MHTTRMAARGSPRLQTRTPGMNGRPMSACCQRSSSTLGSKLVVACPETALMYAVLEEAFLCFHKQFKTEQRFVQRAQKAEDWFFSDDSRWLFSFVSVCDRLGLEQEYIRTEKA